MICSILKDFEYWRFLGLKAVKNKVGVSVNNSQASLQYVRILNLLGKPIESKNYQKLD